MLQKVFSKSTSSGRYGLVAGLCLIMAVLLPSLAALQWVFLDFFQDYWGALQQRGHDPGNLGVWRRALGAAFSLIPALLLSIGLLGLARLFREFSKDRAFSAPAVKAFHRFARLFLWAMIVKPITAGFEGLVLSWSDPEGAFFPLTFTAHEAFQLLLGILLVSISRLFAQAEPMADEQHHFL